MKTFPRILLPVLSLVLLPLSLRAQGFSVPVWSNEQPASFGPANPEVRLQTDTAGNLYVAATVENPGTGDTDVTLFKYGCGGAFQWLRTYDHLDLAQSDSLAGLALDPAGNIYLAVNSAAGPGGGDWVILKYDATGTLLWHAAYGSSGYDRAVGIAVDPRGTVAVAGDFDNATELRAVKLDTVTGAVLTPFGTAPGDVLPATAQAMTLDGTGNLWLVGTAGTNCLTLRFTSAGAGFNFTGAAFSPGAWKQARGQDIAWSRENNLVFVLAGVGGNGTPAQQAVLSYFNVPARHLPLATNWNASGPIPGTDLKRLGQLLVNPTAEWPVAIRVGPGGRVITLAATATAFGPNWLVAGWDPAGRLAAEADSDLGPGGMLPMFDGLTPAALELDSRGRAFVTGTGMDASSSAQATVAYTPVLPAGQDAFNVLSAPDTQYQAQALTVDVIGNVYVNGTARRSNQSALTTLKLALRSPVNEVCAQAQPIGAGTVAFTTLYATNSVPPIGSCPANTKDVWFRWTATGTGLVEVDTFGSCFDTVLAVYTGNCGALTLVPGGCNDNATAGRPIGTTQSFVSFQATAGTTYFIQVGSGTQQPAAGDGRLTIFGPLPPLGTCPPNGASPGVWRKFVVIGTGNSEAGGLWRVTVPNCVDIFGQVPTAVGDSAEVLAAKLASSINAACGSPRLRAIALGRAMYLFVGGCPGDQPVFFRVGPAGTPPNQLCLVPQVNGNGVPDPASPLFCTYNPQLAAVQVGPDCNGNGIPDEVDIASGASQDTNTNGIPDECEGGLRIRPQADQAVLFWGVPNFFLETSPNLSVPSWQSLPGNSPLFVPKTDAERYFRLKQWP